MKMSYTLFLCRGHNINNLGIVHRMENRCVTYLHVSVIHSLNCMYSKTDDMRKYKRRMAAMKLVSIKS